MNETQKLVILNQIILYFLIIKSQSFFENFIDKFL